MTGKRPGPAPPGKEDGRWTETSLGQIAPRSHEPRECLDAPRPPCLPGGCLHQPATVRSFSVSTDSSACMVLRMEKFLRPGQWHRRPASPGWHPPPPAAPVRPQLPGAGGVGRGDRTPPPPTSVGAPRRAAITGTPSPMASHHDESEGLQEDGGVVWPCREAVRRYPARSRRGPRKTPATMVFSPCSSPGGPAATGSREDPVNCRPLPPGGRFGPSPPPGAAPNASRTTCVPLPLPDIPTMVATSRPEGSPGGPGISSRLQVTPPPGAASRSTPSGDHGDDPVRITVRPVAPHGRDR